MGMKQDAKRTGRPSLYKKPYRTSIMQSDVVRDQMLPDLEAWIPGTSRNDIIEHAVRAFHRHMKALREQRGAI
jgi:hypothetical protein